MNCSLSHDWFLGSEGSSREEGSSLGSLWLVLHFLPFFLSLAKSPSVLGLWAPSWLQARTYLWGLENGAWAG